MHPPYLVVDAKYGGFAQVLSDLLKRRIRRTFVTIKAIIFNAGIILDKGQSQISGSAPCLYYTKISGAVNPVPASFTDSCRKGVPQNKSLTGNGSVPSPDGGLSISL